MIQILQTPNKGKGIFTMKNITKDEIVLIITGKLVKDVYDEDQSVGERWLGVGNQEWIDVDENNPMYYMNHSCDPNTKIDGMKVIALRDILDGEELTFDYALTEQDPYWQMKCNCGSSNCRGIIKGETTFVEIHNDTLVSVP